MKRLTTYQKMRRFNKIVKTAQKKYPRDIKKQSKYISKHGKRYTK